MTFKDLLSLAPALKTHPIHVSPWQCYAHTASLSLPILFSVLRTLFLLLAFRLQNPAQKFTCSVKSSQILTKPLSWENEWPLLPHHPVLQLFVDGSLPSINLGSHSSLSGTQYALNKRLLKLTHTEL